LRQRTTDSGAFVTCCPDLQLHGASLESYASLCKLLQDVDPEECYHLAAQSYMSYSFDDEFSTMRINVMGRMNCSQQ